MQTMGMPSASLDSFLVWAFNIVDASIYPLQAYQYFQNALDNYSPLVRWGSVSAIVLFTLIIDLNGIEWLVRFNGTILVVSILPTAAFVLLGLPDIDPKPWVDTSCRPVQYIQLISYVMWLYGGCDSLGVMAGELATPRVTFMKVRVGARLRASDTVRVRVNVVFLVTRMKGGERVRKGLRLTNPSSGVTSTATSRHFTQRF